MAFSGDRCIYICDGDYDYDSYGTAGIPEATCNAGQYTQKGDICGGFRPLQTLCMNYACNMVETVS
jgi:hypothetical protein